MSVLKRLLLGVTACFGSGCGSRDFLERRLLDPCITDGTRLTAFVGVERGVRTTSGGSFNPNGPRTTDAVAQADLHQVEFTLGDGAATLTGARHLLGIAGRPLASAITTTDGGLSLAPLPSADDAEMRVIAPTGNRCCVQRQGRFTVYADATRTTELDAGIVAAPGQLRFTWNGERIYLIVCDAEGRLSRIHTTAVGARGAWEMLTYDAATMPVDGDPGSTFVEAYDRVDGDPVLLLRKHYTAREGAERRSATCSILRGSRLVSTWTDSAPGWIQPDIRAVVGWQRSHGSLQATLTLRSLDDGALRMWNVDARAALTRPGR